jgi:purine nucleosidase
MDKIPILLDTDIGSDIDDAVALAYLLRQPRCELLGITTVAGEPEKRAALADAICQAAGRPDVPIHVGLPSPMLIAAKQPKAPQFAALTERWRHRAFPAKPTAVDFLRQTIRARPGEITLLAIGPLTDIAVLFALDPEIPSLLKSLVLMGGWFFDRPQPEWNIANDPHAAQMVFQAPVPSLTAVGIDVTRLCLLVAEECRRRFADAGGPLSAVADMAEVWFHYASQITFHDPLAAALIFEPTLCGLEVHQVDVELDSLRHAGLTLPVSDSAKRPHHIAATVDFAAFFDHYFSVVTASAVSDSSASA